MIMIHNITIATITMRMIMIIRMIMILTVVLYHHHEAPNIVRDSIGGCSMDMWCPDGIGRESWDREGREGIGRTPSPERGDFASWCVSRRRV